MTSRAMALESYRPWLPGQPLLFAPDVRRWLPDDHLAWFVMDLVDHLDLSPIDEAIQAKDPRGTQPYDPRMMVALLVYAYAVGVFSSRRIERSRRSAVNTSTPSRCSSSMWSDSRPRWGW